MFLTGVILFVVALTLAFGGLFKVYRDVSPEFDNLMKVIVAVMGAVAFILIIASPIAAVTGT